MGQPRIFYIANMRFPTERAHGIQVAKMCEAFARHGAKVTLLVPDRKTISEDPFSYYGIERTFQIEWVSVPDIVSFGTAGFLIESLLFARRAARRVAKDPNAVVYTREELPLFFLPRASAFYEAHQLRRSFLFRWLIRRAKRIISITQGLKDALVRIGFPGERILVAHDGYDEEQFAERIPKAEARKRLGLPADGKIAMYIGGLEGWKGAEILCKAAESLTKDRILVVIIGGIDKELKRFRMNYPSVRFVGARPYRELPVNQRAADILVVPNSMHSHIGSTFTSPLKLFAHMASGVALVVSDVPALREVVLSSQAYLFSPDDPQSLAAIVRKALSPEGATERLSMATEAKKRAPDFTWDKRAKNVLAYIYSCLRQKESS